jgi:adenosylmethionine---8-amino-7-oxononanoate aminotransferase
VESAKSLSERDAGVIWHPFTQMQTAKPAIPIVRAKGAYLYAEDQTAYLDAISSWWVNLHGHAHPHISSRIALQAEQLEHVMFAGFTHAGAVELAEKLTALTKMDKLFYSDNGSTAVETALKMALQFWYNASPRTKRKKILCFKGGYHGDTFGAMSASGKNSFNRPFWDHLFPSIAIDIPLCGQETLFLQKLHAALKTNEIAAFIFEPLILGSGGMKLYSKELLCTALRLCRENGVLTIADEVMTGFGRTGTLFACDQLTEQPDLLCLSKGITGGFLPLGATLCKQEIFDAFLSPSYTKALLHGHTYSANPLACAAALASLELLLTPYCATQRELIAKNHSAFCETMRSHPALVRCESLGTILILEYRSSKSSTYLNPLRDLLSDYFIERKILLRPLGNTVYVIPPYCITEKELIQIYAHLASSLEIVP